MDARSPLWRPADRRARKPGSANIFGGVALWQLQKLFQVAGDQDAEQRAQLVWGDGGEADLAQALIGLRARGRRRGLRTGRRDGQMGSRWLNAFHHMRIGEASPNTHGGRSHEDNNNNNNNNNDENDDSDTETLNCSSDPRTRPLAAEDTGATVSHPQGPIVTSERQSRAGLGPRRGGDSRPERYLHRIIH